MVGEWNRGNWISKLGLVFQASSGTAVLITFLMEVGMLARLEERRIRKEATEETLKKLAEQAQANGEIIIDGQRFVLTQTETLSDPNNALSKPKA